MIQQTTTQKKEQAQANLRGEKTEKKKNTKVHPVVIDEQMIMQSVKDYQVENKILAEIDLQKIIVLNLSFQNIWKIKNLEGINNLEKLQLDNNLIEEIENIGHLTNLKWLDLSFNCLEKISGLENLINLTDLSLYNNQISSLEGLQNLSKLNVFSIGNNKIKSFETFINTFGFGTGKTKEDEGEVQGSNFKELQVLNVMGNPFTQDGDYKDHLIFNLVNLKYLDYVYIDETKRKELEEDDKFSSELQNLIKKKEAQKSKEDEEKGQYEQFMKKKESKMDQLENLADNLLNADQDLQEIKIIKGFDDEISKFIEKSNEEITNLQKTIMQKNEAKQKMVKMFFESMEKRERLAEDESIGLLQQFEVKKKDCFKKVDNEEKGSRKALELLMEETKALQDTLLTMEALLCEEMDEHKEKCLGRIEEKQEEMKNDLEPVLKLIQENIKEFVLKITEIGQNEAKTFAAIYVKMDPSFQGNDAEEDEFFKDYEWTKDQRGILRPDNSDQLNTQLSNIKESLNDLCDKKFTSIITMMTEEMKRLQATVKDRMHERNRKNVDNIFMQIKDSQQQIQEKLLIEEESEDSQN